MEDQTLQGIELSKNINCLVNTASKYQDLSFDNLQLYYSFKDVKRSLKQIKKSLGLLTDDGKFNVLAQLLSDNSHVSVSISIYLGTSKEDKLYSVKEFSNQCILYIIEEVLRYGDVINIIQASKSIKGIKEDAPLFDEESFSAAVILAFLYCNWNDNNSPTINIFSDRIEVEATGFVSSNQYLDKCNSEYYLPISNNLSKIFSQFKIQKKNTNPINIIVEKYGKDAFEFNDCSLLIRIPFNWIDIVKTEEAEETNKTNLFNKLFNNNSSEKLHLSSNQIVTIIFSLCFLVFVSFMLLRDTDGPVIVGAKDITVTLGDPILYRQDVEAIDEKDGPVDINIDTSLVNSEQAGIYPVTYWAIDSKGNKSDEITINLTIEEPPYDPIAGALEELDTSSELYSLAIEVYNSIIKDTDAPIQKAQAIYNWVQRNIAYTGHSEKSTWQQGALDGFKYRKGDCYTYFSCVKALLVIAEIENTDVVKIKMEGRSNHYWSLFKVNDEWYHIDSTPRYGSGSHTFFMYTDEQMLNYSEQHENCFDFDLTLYPRTPGSISDKYLIKFYPEWFDENGQRLVDVNGNLAGSENYNSIN